MWPATPNWWRWLRLNLGCRSACLLWIHELFPAAVAAGAAMVEIGNYDSFYPQGRLFDAAEVLELTRRTRQLLPEVTLSVTVPHTLPLDQQEQLAIDLVDAGADWIQTEGGTSANPLSPGVQGLIEKASPTLAAAQTASVNSGERLSDAAGGDGHSPNGKTFTMANVIAQTGRPALVLAHNKTLAAQLCNELREFFPENAVEYFISYYDYYQPEAYVPV